MISQSKSYGYIGVAMMLMAFLLFGGDWYYNGFNVITAIFLLMSVSIQNTIISLDAERKENEP